MKTEENEKGKWIKKEKAENTEQERTAKHQRKEIDKGREKQSRKG